MRTSVMRQAAAFVVDAAVVGECLDAATAGDSLFAKAWQSGPASLTRAEKCGVAGVTGHVADSVAAVLLDRVDWRVLWHLTGPGRHQVDLVFLTPDDKVVAVEVKGMLVAGRIPRLSRRVMVQMSDAWIDKTDNPGMAELGLQGTDIYGAVVAVDFADMTWRTGMTADLATLYAVLTVEQLAGLDWISGN